jgi:hypothetical protein|tara:strand:- start:4525 stop:4815 length:291 start_codon:yes stop_codon:yes gene_type:complete
MKESTKLKRKLKQNQDLATKALKDKPEWKAAKGYKYLEDCKPGTQITTSTSEAILINIGTGSCTVIVTEWFGHPENTTAHIGKRQWALKTEVKEVS